MSIHEQQQAFFAIDKPFAEAEGDVFARMSFITAVWPPARGVDLWDDLDEDLAHVWEFGTGLEVSAALDFIMLRYRFIEDLHISKTGRRHINIWWLESTAAWRNRLIDRMNVLEPVGRYTDDDGDVTISIPPIPTPTLPKWLH